MTQSRNEYDISKVDPYLRIKPEATNKELYLLCNAITETQKGSVRKTRSRFLLNKNDERRVETTTEIIEKKSPPKSPVLSNMKITKETLQPLIASALMEDPTNTQILRIAVDFCKINDAEEDIGEMDLTPFLTLLEKTENTY